MKNGGSNVTDNWDSNTNCYYFDTKEQADKFEFRRLTIEAIAVS